MSERKAFFGVLAMAGAQAARYGLQVAVLPVLARLLGPASYGLVGLAMPFILLANLVADMGLGNALVRIPEPGRTLESTVFWISEATCAGLAILLCLLAWPAALMFSAPGLAPILWSLTPILLLGGALSAPNARIMRERRFTVFAASETVAGLIGAGAAIAAALAGWGAWSLVLQQLVVWAVKSAWVLKASAFRPSFEFDFAAARPHLAFGLHTAGASFADTLSKSAPALIIGALLSVTEVGHYTMAFQLIRVPDALVTGPVYLAIFAAVSRASSDLKAAGELTIRALRGTAVGVAPMFFGLAVVADLAVKLFLGQKWLGAIDILILLTPAGFLICFYSTVIAALLGLGRSAEQLHLTLFTGLFMNIGVLIGAQFSAAGAAAGLSAGALLITPAYVWILAKGLGLPARVMALETMAPIAASLVMVIAVLLVRIEIRTWPNWAQLATAIGVGAAAFAVSLALFAGSKLWVDIREVLPSRLAL
jgi:polysaccharide transporter, PST family